MMPLTDDEVRALGFEPGRRGWRAVTAELDLALMEAGGHGYTDPIPKRIPGPTQTCIVCETEPTEPSSVGTPTCSALCAAVLAHNIIPGLSPALLTRGDGSGGTSPTIPPKPKRSPRPARGETASLEVARDRLGDVRAVLERHGARIRGRMAFCPLHENSRTPAMSLYERSDRSRAHCHACLFDGDAIDLEAALTGSSIGEVIRGWGS